MFGEKVLLEQRTHCEIQRVFSWLWQAREYCCLPVYPVATSSKTFRTETVLKSNGCFGSLASAAVNICCWLNWMVSCLSASSFNQSTFLTWEDSSPILIVTLWPFDPMTCPRVGWTVNVSPDSCFFSTLSDLEDVFFLLFVLLTHLLTIYCFDISCSTVYKCLYFICSGSANRHRPTLSWSVGSPVCRRILVWLTPSQ